MSIRITTNGLFRSYRSNLQTSTRNLSDAMKKVETGRQFTSYAEDPATATQAFQLRRSMWRTENQITNSNYVISKVQTAWDAMDKIVDGNDNTPGLDGIASSLAVLNDPSGGSRKSLGSDLISTSEAITQVMNSRFGDTYVFSGNDGLTVPFTWDGDKLLYRGLDVSNPLLVNDANGVITLEEKKQAEDFTSEDGTLDEEAYAAYEQQYSEAEQLLAMSRSSSTYNEGTFVDVGLGMREEDGALVEATAFNSSLSGIDMLGFGVDEDGEPVNLAVIMRKLGVLANNCDPDTGDYSDDSETNAELKDYACDLAGRLQLAIDRVSEKHVELDGQASYLQTNLSQLESTSLTLNEQIVDLEDVDAADAITEMMYAQYCYNAALKIGTDILSESLIDYMS